MDYKKLIAASLLLCSPGIANSTELRAGLFRYDGGAALYAFQDGQNLICDGCPPPPSLSEAPPALTIPAEPEEQPMAQLVIEKPCFSPSTNPVLQERSRNLTTVYFKFDDAHLSVAQKTNLRRSVAKLDMAVVVRVDAYTCRIGSSAYNQSLSVRRAKTVASYLRKMGVNVVEIDGHGKTHSLGGPLAKDRRAEILIKERTFINEEK